MTCELPDADPTRVPEVNRRPRKEDPFAFIEASSIPPFTREEEFDLFTRWRGGDNQAREHLARANLRWMMKIAHEYAKRASVDVADLLSVGGEAMTKALNKFDHTRGLRFTTYMNWWVQRYMQDHLALANTPLSGHRTWRTHLHFRLRREASRIVECEDPREEIKKLSTELKISEDLLSIAIELELGSTSSLDKPLFQSTESLHDRLASPQTDPEAQTADRERRDYIAQSVHRALDALPERDREIVKSRILVNGNEQTLEQLGDRYGLTKERIRQIETRAVKKLRELLSEFRLEGVPLPVRLLIPKRGGTRKIKSKIRRRRRR